MTKIHKKFESFINSLNENISSELENNNKIKDWSDEKVNRVFSSILDEMSSVESDDISSENTETEDKRNYIISTQDRFEYLF